MPPDILFDTNRFNLSEVKEHFINPGCFGEDLAVWLRAKLIERGIPRISRTFAVSRWPNRTIDRPFARGGRLDDPKTRVG